MASTTVTSLTTAAANENAANDDKGSPFLRLAAELRNRIYKHAFADVKKTGPVPHALTQTNRQIRSESRAMYYASIECIEINIRTRAQYDRTKKWLAEEDWLMFPVMPDFTFFTYSISCNKDVALSCYRETIVPKDEYPLQLAYLQGRYMMDWKRVRKATMRTHAKCLGIPEVYVLEDGAPESFTQVIESGAKWSMRRLECTEEDVPLYYKFFRHADGKQGSDWTKSDLETIVSGFWHAVRCRERHMPERATRDRHTLQRSTHDDRMRERRRRQA